MKNRRAPRAHPRRLSLETGPLFFFFFFACETNLNREGRRMMAAEVGDIFRCKDSGLVVEVVGSGSGTLTCCGAPMERLEEQTADATTEKHVPVVERVDGGYKVAVGSVPHPMGDDHHIDWIELRADGNSYRRFLKPGEAPEAVFPVAEASEVAAREHCNKHGLWKS